MSYLTTILTAQHDKQAFSCGKEVLDNYFHKQAKQDIKRKLAACFILSDDGIEVKGFYTLSSTSINRDILPENIIRKLPPNYKNLPATLLGRLAVSEKYKGKGLGTLLLIDALKRCFDNIQTIASMTIIVDPLDDEAIRFYEHFGFILLPDSRKMFIPTSQIEDLF